MENDFLMGNDLFIDARSSVKRSFIYTIFTVLFAVFYINNLKNGYKTGIIFTNLAQSTNVFEDLLWWANLMNLISTVVLVAVIAICRFKWLNNKFVAIPAAVKLVCSAVLAYVIYTRNYKVLTESVEQGVYRIKDGFLVFTIIYVVSFLLLLVSVFVNGKGGKAIGIIALLLCTSVTVASFFSPTVYAFPYEYIKSATSTYNYSYRSLSAQVNDLLFILSAVSMSYGLNVYNACKREDAQAQADADEL